MAFGVLSTYRLQMRGDCFTFDDALKVLDYLAALGVSHLYLSPILTAVEDSTHGYDVTDPTTVSAALGGPEGLKRLSAAAQARGMGLIVDIVPNHVGVEKPDQNRWWRDVLERGRNSPYASYFDVDWHLDPDGRIVLPVLGSDDEPLEPTLPVAGTTGYDALREIGGLLIDPAGVGPLTTLFESSGVPYDDMPQLARRLKADAVTGTLGSELARLHRTIVSATGVDHPDLPRALAELISRLHVYRSDYLSLSLMLSEAMAETAAALPELAQPVVIVSAALTTSVESAVRLQQLSGAATAKSMEDCLFYRDARLVSLNEVGGEPDRFGVSAAEFHQRAASRSRLWPHAMVALTTHDTKRGEDVRARIGVLSQVPTLWAGLVGKWALEAPPPDAATGLFLLQNIFGVWPVDGVVTDELRGRLHAYTEKAIREAAVHTTWNDPDTTFETAVHTWLNAVMDGPVATGLTSLVIRLDEHARNDCLGQKLVALTVPGVPDVYQGTELWEDSLVDPDNRRPVDYHL